MAASKEIEIIINEDGTVELEQKGWSGKQCEGAIDDIIRAIGREVKSSRNKDWYKKQRIDVHQRHSG